MFLSSRRAFCLTTILSLNQSTHQKVLLLHNFGLHYYQHSPSITLFVLFDCCFYSLFICEFSTRLLSRNVVNETVLYCTGESSLFTPWKSIIASETPQRCIYRFTARTSVYNSVVYRNATPPNSTPSTSTVAVAESEAQVKPDVHVSDVRTVSDVDQRAGNLACTQTRL